MEAAYAYPTRYVPHNLEEAAAARSLEGPPVRLSFDSEDLPPLPANLAAVDAAIAVAMELVGEDPRAIWRSAIGNEGSVSSSVAEDACYFEDSGSRKEAGVAVSALSGLVSLPYLSLLAYWLEHRPTQLCAQRLIMPGAKGTLVGGNAEGGIFRDLALHARLRVGAKKEGGVRESEEKATTTTKKTGKPLLRSRSKRGKKQQARVLLFDRSSTHRASSSQSSESFSSTPSFHNRAEIEAVLRHYGVNYTLLLDNELGSFDEQAALFSHFKLLITGHGAGLANAIFMPPRSAIIEISPFSVWRPSYLKAAVLAGHAFFPIYSRLLPPQRLGDRRDGLASAGLAHIRETCERSGPVQATVVGEETCRQLYRNADPIVAPIHEFESTLLEALDAVGINRQHRGALFHMLHGVVGEGEDDAANMPLLAHMAEDFYDQRKWAICPKGTSADSLAKASIPRSPWPPAREREARRV
jgi:hypothetical protein